MAFLKQADTLRNLYQFVLAADRNVTQPGAAIEQLVVLRHDYPFELETFGTAAAQTIYGHPASNGEERCGLPEEPRSGPRHSHHCR